MKGEHPICKVGLFTKISKTENPHSQSVAGIEFEIHEYAEFDCIHRNNDPLEWWKANQKKFPALSRIAKRYLTAPSTSILSERLFNVARDIFHYRRTSLSPQSAEMLVFLNHAIPELNYVY